MKPSTEEERGGIKVNVPVNLKSSITITVTVPQLLLEVLISRDEAHSVTGRGTRIIYVSVYMLSILISIEPWKLYVCSMFMLLFVNKLFDRESLH